MALGWQLFRGGLRVPLWWHQGCAWAALGDTEVALGRYCGSITVVAPGITRVA